MSCHNCESNATPCDPNIPTTCTALDAVTLGARVVVEDSSDCKRTISSPANSSLLTYSGGNVRWRTGSSTDRICLPALLEQLDGEIDTIIAADSGGCLFRSRADQLDSDDTPLYIIEKNGTIMWRNLDIPDGFIQTVMLADGLISNTKLNASAIHGQSSASPGSNDEFLFYQISTGNLKKTTLSSISVQTGSCMWWPLNTAPTGYLECNGAAISRTTYANLFSVIGVQWGSGDGSTTFNLPDTRGYFIRGWSHGSSIDSGRAFASTQQDAFQGHDHATNNVYLDVTDHLFSSGEVDDYHSGTVGAPTDLAGYGTVRFDTETRPINIAMMFVIKY